MIVTCVVTARAPPAPVRNRNATSCPKSFTRPEPIDAIATITPPARNTGLRPMRSVSAPPGKFSRIRARVKALMSRLTSAIETPKSNAKRGRTGPTMCQFRKTAVMRNETIRRYSFCRLQLQTLTPHATPDRRDA
jgi:hypothetical protein